MVFTTLCGGWLAGVTSDGTPSWHETHRWEVSKGRLVLDATWVVFAKVAAAVQRQC